jgi:hypothetical protein
MPGRNTIKKTARNGQHYWIRPTVYDVLDTISLTPIEKAECVKEYLARKNGESDYFDIRQVMTEKKLKKLCDPNFELH